MRVLKEPFVQFLIGGALVFLVYSFSRSADEAVAEKRIAIDGPTQEWIYGNFAKQFRRPPSRLEMGSLIKTYIEHEVKYREALEMGLDDRDTIVRRRMMQKFDFLFGNAAADSVPKAGDLQDWYETHSDEFALPPTVSFTHLWFSPDERGDAVMADAETALATLRAGGNAKGDRFPFEAAFEDASPAVVRNVLGPEFTEAVFQAPLDVWTGPITSGLGVHLVLVTDKTDRMLLPLEELHDAVLQHWRDAESDRILAEMIEGLKAE